MNSYSQKYNRADTVNINGRQTYYEVYGHGKPLFLLHGFTQSSKSWKQVIPEYYNEYEVYLVDLMGHGKSSAFTENVSLRSAAQNLLGLIEYIGLENINAIGYSYGGEILFQLALIKPDLIKSMIIIGSCGSWDAEEFPEFVEYLSYKNLENLPWMLDQQISDERIRNILDQVPNYSVYLSETELKSIKSRTLLVVGDNDHATPLECIIRSKSNMPNAYLWIVPNSEHRPHLDRNKDLFIKTSKDFFGENNW